METISAAEKTATGEEDFFVWPCTTKIRNIVEPPSSLLHWEWLDEYLEVNGYDYFYVDYGYSLSFNQSFIRKRMSIFTVPSAISRLPQFMTGCTSRKSMSTFFPIREVISTDSAASTKPPVVYRRGSSPGGTPGLKAVPGSTPCAPTAGFTWVGCTALKHAPAAQVRMKLATCFMV